MSDPYDIQNAELMDMSTPSSRKKKVIITVIVLLLVVVLAVTCALVVKFYVISTFVVQGTSMWPTLNGGAGEQNDNDLTNGDILYLNKLAKIKRGDIVVCTPEWPALGGHSIVKRVIGVAGDTVEVRDNNVYLNGTSAATWTPWTAYGLSGTARSSAWATIDTAICPTTVASAAPSP